MTRTVGGRIWRHAEIRCTPICSSFPTFTKLGCMKKAPSAGWRLPSQQLGHVQAAYSRWLTKAALPAPGVQSAKYDGDEDSQPVLPSGEALEAVMISCFLGHLSVSITSKS